MNSKGINVLSFFDGMSAGQEALRQLGVKVNRYIAIEIDKSSIEITQANFPRTEQKGDILIVKEDLKDWVSKLPKIDLIFAGSPCRKDSLNQVKEKVSTTLDQSCFIPF